MPNDRLRSFADEIVAGWLQSAGSQTVSSKPAKLQPESLKSKHASRSTEAALHAKASKEHSEAADNDQKNLSRDTPRRNFST